MFSPPSVSHASLLLLDCIPRREGRKDCRVCTGNCLLFNWILWDIDGDING